MTSRSNPFEFSGANDLPADMVLDYYIEDFNYSRFLQSKRNILLVGERGCGKSMTLLYNSWPIRRLKAIQESTLAPFDHVGIYVPCNTPLIHKDEHQLFDESLASILAEHSLVISLLFEIARTLAEDESIMKDADEELLRTRLEFILDEDLTPSVPFFQCIQDFAQRVNLKTQQHLSRGKSSERIYGETYSFSSLILPFLGLTRFIPAVQKTHFMFLIDDAQYLNQHQLASLCSWIAYRDHSLFSFKVAMASIAESKLHTASGGSILEGHDYLQLDMVQPFQNEMSDFGRLAEGLVTKRFKRFSIESSPEDFFPISKQLREELAESESSVRKDAEKLYGSDTRRVSDYVYKHKRAHYFRNRPPHANLPEYSGFQTLVFLSTGVIRNLLTPPHAMYDKMLSRASNSNLRKIECIPPRIQSEVVLEQSRKLWDRLREGIDKNIVGCSSEDALRCYQLLDQLAFLFRRRLLEHESEPCANSFTISSKTHASWAELERLVNILREAQLLYRRSGSAKDKGKREWYYVPNRLLWPVRGLDPHGQHARVSLRASDLWAAADQNCEIPFRNSGDPESLWSLLDDTN